MYGNNYINNPYQPMQPLGYGRNIMGTEQQNTMQYPPFYNMQTQQQPAQPPYAVQNISIKGRPVSNMEEAKASMIDLDGTLFVFPDVANGKIYTKQAMMDGTADFRVYCLDGLEEETEQKKPVKKQKAQEFVPMDVFNKTINQLKEQIKTLESEVSYEPSISDNGKPVVKK